MGCGIHLAEEAILGCSLTVLILLLFSRQVMSDPYELHHSGPPCPRPSPRVCPSSCPLMPFNHLILCRPLLPLPSVLPSIRVFSNKSVLGIKWPNCWSFSFSISPSNEYSGRISFRIDWFDLLAVQGTLESSPLFSTLFKSINYLVLSFLHGPTLTSIYDYFPPDTNQMSIAVLGFDILHML